MTDPVLLLLMLRLHMPSSVWANAILEKLALRG